MTILLAGLAAAGCGGGPDPPPPDATIIDERAGTVDGIALGDQAAEIRRALRPSSERRMAPILPKDLDNYELGLPGVLVAVPDVRRTEVVTMRRDGLSVLVAPRKGAYALFVWRAAARTKGGVAIGDELEAARDTYSGLECGVRNRGSEYPDYPFCKGRIGGNYVWFGQDPIRSITVSATGLG